ncbi:MAG: YybH family protein [Bacteroidota bacterium]
MNRILLLPLLLILACTSNKTEPVFSAKEDETTIRSIMARQETAWNAGDLDHFMEGYWKSDSLQFIGRRITHGWDSTLASYKRGYPDRSIMGTLKFDLYQFKFIGTDACLVTGRYTLTRAADQPTGMFTLLWRRKPEGWVIVYDHSS